MTDIVKLYNPSNAAALTPEELAGLQNLTSAEIKELAQAYPNRTMTRAYLLIADGSKPIEKQLPSLSTFENLWNLREKNSFKNHVAIAFQGTYKAVPRATARPQKQEVLDLSDTELMSLPGFKTANKVEPAQQVKVTKINKVAKQNIEATDTETKAPVKTATKKAATKKTKSK